MVFCLACGAELLEVQKNHLVSKKCKAAQKLSKIEIDSQEDYHKHFGVNPKDPSIYQKRIKKMWKTRKQKDPTNKSSKQAWTTRKEKYGPSGGNTWAKRRISDPNNEWAIKAWEVRRESR